MDAFAISLIVPTRNRLTQLRTFLDSVAETVKDTRSVEVVLVMDEDDPDSHTVHHDRLTIVKRIGPPGRTMGQLNNEGVRSASGTVVMLLNDDVVCQTPGWDAIVANCFAACPDDILLVHVNDTLMQTELCTFPIVSRTYCELLGGICPENYQRYRIDDHIEDVFNLLGVLGEQRTVYLPDVVFAHHNYEEREPGKKQYFADDAILAVDAPTFEQYLTLRKQHALQLMAHIHPSAPQSEHWQDQLQPIRDSFSLRTPERLRVLPTTSERQFRDLHKRICRHRPGPSWSAWQRRERTRNLVRSIHRCYRTKGVSGLLRAIHRRLFGVVRTGHDKTGNSVCGLPTDSVLGHFTDGTSS